MVEDRNALTWLPRPDLGRAVSAERFKEFCFLEDLVARKKKPELLQTIVDIKTQFPFLGATNSPNDLIAQLIAYQGVFRHFTPRNHKGMVVIMQYESSTAHWVKKYQNYIVWDPQLHLIHRVIKTAQQPIDDLPYLTLNISTLSFTKYGIPQLKNISEEIAMYVNRK